jgi:cytoskeletal protein CcmA (bactofilin family)
MAVNFRGYVFQDDGDAVNGATVQLLETGTTTVEASTTTDSDGLWSFSESDQDRYDVKITSGTSVRYIRWDDQVSFKELDVRNNTGNTTPAATFTNITNNAANQVAVFSGANSTRADNDEIYASFKLADSAGNLDEFARMTVVATDVTSGSEDGQIEFDVMKAGTLTKVWTITSSTGAAMSFDMNVDALTIGSGADTDVSLTFDANSADGVITWMEDEDYFKFSDDILMNSTERINFYDTAIYIYSSTDGQLDLVADTEIQIAATTIDINGAVALNGAITGATDITLSGELDAATLDISGNADIDGTTNLDAVDIDGAVQIDATFTSGVDGQGYDTKFFGDTSGAYILWDTSADKLLTAGGAVVDIVKDKLLIGGTAVTTTAAELNLLDGSAKSTSSITIADADAFVVIDGTTTKQIPASDIKTYAGGATAADDIGTGDGAVNVVTTSGNITLDAQANDADVIIKVDDNGSAVTAVTFDGSDEGNAIFVNDIQLKSDSAVLKFGTDLDTTLTHTDGTGLTLNSTNKLTFGDTGTFIHQSADGVLTIESDTTVDINGAVALNGAITGATNITLSGELDAATLDISGAVDIDGAVQIDGTVTVGVDDTGLDVKFFGASAGAYMEWDQSEDQLRIMGASADATTSTGKLLLATSLTDINANDVIGKIDFQAPHEAGGTDAITVAASIQAIAQDTFSSSVNATDLIFYTGHSEAATEKFRFTSQGEIGVGGANYGTDGQVLTSGGAGAAPAWEDASGSDGINLTKSSVGHGITDIAGTTVYGLTTFDDADGGGLKLIGLTDTDHLESAIVVEGILGGAAQTAKGGSSTGLGVVALSANIKSGTGITEVGSNGNLVSIDNQGSVRFIFDAEGTGHADDDWTTYSDNRLKQDQEAVPYGLAEILRLTPKIYTRSSGVLNNGEVTLTAKSSEIRRQIGFIAQEVKEIIPEIVREIDETKSFYSLNDGKIMAVAVKAIQELSTQVNALDARITVLESA